MKTSARLLIFALALSGWTTGALCATQSSPQAEPPKDTTKPSYDMKAQAAVDLQDMQKKFTAMAEAIPQDKYSWRPGEGARTFSELFLHVAAAGFNFPTMKGTPPFPDFQGKGFEKSTTDKAKVIDWLNKSFAYSIASVQSMSNADFANPLPKLGPEANAGDVVYLMVVHAHEQLGISIAYSRALGIVPPWTADALKKKAQNP